MGQFFSSIFLAIVTFFSSFTGNTPAVISNVTSPQGSTQQVAYTQDQLLAMAGNPYAHGNLPLGDGKYVTDAPKQGYIYLCTVPRQTGGGAQQSGNWITGSTWNPQNKPSVAGSVSWSTAAFTDTVSGGARSITGNGLPVNTTTGTFPIVWSDPAYQYDRNPNSIKAQAINLTLPVAPVYSDVPYCMGMEVGIMTNGVPLFNGFDAELRDAAAHEVQDSCDGHPQSNGEYHYHSLSRCISSSETHVIGFALDGFPITGPQVAPGKYLTTKDLDVCHGITSAITLDGKQVTMYHYVMTQDFPYSVSCFRGKPVGLQVTGSLSPTAVQQNQNTIRGPQLPQGALDACANQSSGNYCWFVGPNGRISGTCGVRLGASSLVCIPNSPRGQ